MTEPWAVTGRNSFFVMSPADARAYRINDLTIPLVARSAQLAGVIYTDEDHTEAGEAGSRTALLNARGVALSEHRGLREYVALGEEQDVHTGYKCGIRKEWWVVPSLWEADAFMLRQIHTHPRVIANLTNATSTDTVHRMRVAEGVDASRLATALGIDRPVHFAGWSTGGAAVAQFAQDRPVASLTLIDPVSPYGFGGVQLDGTPCFPDYAGSGGGTGTPDFVARLDAGDRSDESPFSPRNALRTSYWSPRHVEPPEREDVYVDEVLLSRTGDDGYPGDATASDNWPGTAPGTRGVLNALSPKYCDWSALVDVDPKPPVLWTHGTEDIVIADGSPWEMGNLGAAGHVPGWPGPDVFPPQQMVAQIRTLLEHYEAAGGRVRMEMFEGSGHFPVIDAADPWRALFFGFLHEAEQQQSSG